MLLLLISPTVYTIVIFQPCSVYILMLLFSVYNLMLLLLISPTVYTIVIFLTIVYTVGEISNNNIKIYTEQGWKMVIVYTVGEIKINIKIYTEHRWKMSIYTCHLPTLFCVYFDVIPYLSNSIYNCHLPTVFCVYFDVIFNLSNSILLER
jgi:hypothetical protein